MLQLIRKVIVTSMVFAVLGVYSCSPKAGKEVVDGQTGDDQTSPDSRDGSGLDPDSLAELLPGDSVVPGDLEQDRQDSGLPMGNCCESDADCVEYLTCVGYGDVMLGRCVPTPPAGQCFWWTQCGPDEVCEGAQDPSCANEEFIVDNVGTCVPEGPEPCCEADSHCPDGQFCLDLPDGAACHPRPLQGDGECYRDIDCGEGGYCDGEATCGCFEDCMLESVGPGHCKVEPTPNCCNSDDDCIAGLKCVGSAFASGGICMSDPEPGECFTTTDCGSNHFCFGQTICSCDMNCISEPGVCAPVQGFCCDTDLDCEPGFICFPTGDIGGCEPAPPFEGKCWRDEHCPDGWSCEGGWACPCTADCDGVDTYGTCEPPILPCGCLFDADCVVGEVCVVIPGGDGVCAPAPAFGECFSNAGCFEMSQQCSGATVCPCDAICDVATGPGKCTPLPSGCCYSDSDCGPDEVCRGTNPGAKMPGSCKDDLSQLIGCPAPGGCCWDDSDCPTGKTCTGGSVCGCIELCYVCGACMEDQTGECI